MPQVFDKPAGARSRAGSRSRGPLSLFFQVPKTGSTTVRKALRRQGLPAVEGKRHRVPAELAGEIDLAQRFTYCFVRHPVSWWRSEWMHMLRRRGRRATCRDSYWYAEAWQLWDFMRYPPDSKPWNDAAEFDRFVDGVLSARGPVCSRLFGWFAPHVDFVGRTENLMDDLCTALERAGEPFDGDAILSTGRHNRSRRTFEPWPQTARKIAKAEDWAMREFGYSLQEPKRRTAR